MNILTKICFNPLFASQFLKPKGFFGIIISKVMRDNNFFVYPGIEAYADFKKNQYILEIGYGPGVGINYFLSKYDIFIDGIDFSKIMFSQAKKRNKQHMKEGKLNLYNIDFENFASQDNKYDKIVFANVIYFWKDLNQIFSKIYKLLKSNGNLIFYMSSKGLLNKNRVADNPLFIKHSEESVENKLKEERFVNIAINSIINSDNEYLIITAQKK